MAYDLGPSLCEPAVDVHAQLRQLVLAVVTLVVLEVILGGRSRDFCLWRRAEEGKSGHKDRYEEGSDQRSGEEGSAGAKQRQ